MIGIISDTHDNISAIKKAVEIFKKRNVDLVLHLGDIIAPVTVLYFKGLRIKFILGNCDGDVENIKRIINEIDGEFLGIFSELELENKKIALLHGQDTKKLNELILTGQYNYILHGHTHVKRNEKVGMARIINPGAFYPTVEEKTIAILDVINDEVEFIKID